MPPPGFKSVTLPDDVINDLHRVYREISAVGTRSLPRECVPPEYVDKVPLTLAMVVRMSVLSLEREIRRKRKR